MARRSNSSDRHAFSRRERKKFEAYLADLHRDDQAVWRSLQAGRAPGHRLCESFSSCMELTHQATLRYEADGPISRIMRPRSQIVGDNFLNLDVQTRLLADLENTTRI